MFVCTSAPGDHVASVCRVPDCAAVLPLVDVRDARPTTFALRLAGTPLLTHCLRQLDEAGLSVVVAAPATVDLAGVAPATVVEHDGEYHSALTAATRALPGSTTSVLVHDPAYPATPSQVLRESVRQASGPQHPVVLVRRVVADTIKTISDGFVGDTVPREELESVQAPVVVPRDLLEAVVDEVSPRDYVQLVAAVLARASQVVRRDGSLLGQAVRTPADLILLECALKVSGTP